MMRVCACRAAVSSRATGMVLIAVNLFGCGVLGAPIPPEDVGVSPVIERQLRREGLLPAGSTIWGTVSRPNAPSGISIEEVLISPDPNPLPTPPLREMGTR